LTLTCRPTGELDLDQRRTQMAILSKVIHGQADLSIPRRHPHACGDRNAPGARSWSAKTAAGATQEGYQEIPDCPMTVPLLQEV
jgi:hypothetical protein